jgi:hypothetical protein
LLPSSNSRLTSTNFTCPGISSPLLRYHDENVRRAHSSVTHSFPGKNPGESAENGSLKTYCSLIPHRTTTGFQHVPCSCQPYYFLESWLLQDGNYSTPSSLVELFVSEELAYLRTDKNTLLDFCSTDPWEFLIEIRKRWPCLIHSLNEVLH